MRPLSPFRRPAPSVAVALLGVAVLVAACGGAAASPTTSPTAAPPTTAPATEPPSAEPSTATVDHSGLCALLKPKDFAKVGIDGTQAPTVNADEYGAYCTFAEATGSTSRVELDVFPHATKAEAKDTYVTARGEGPRGEEPAGSTFDQASFAIDDETAYLVVRDGTLVIALSATNDMNVDQGLVSLAKLVVKRAAAAGG
jgi:hypothetical protein